MTNAARPNDVLETVYDCIEVGSSMAKPSLPIKPYRLSVLVSHPIQYLAPWFQHLARIFDLEVLYAHRQDAAGQGAAGFGVSFEWDVPLLEGYRYRWLKNVSRNPGLQTFWGCDTPELYDLIRPENYDALLVPGWNRKSFIQGICAAWQNKVPVLARGDSQLRTNRSTVKRALKFLPYRCFLPRINAHLYVGKRNREYLRHYGVREEQLFFSPHFVDNEFFAARAQEARSSGAMRTVRDRFEIPQDAYVALFVGKFISKKRPADFVRATLRAAKARQNFHALLVGDGPLRQQVKSEAIGSRAQIHFAGFQNQTELPAFYAAADVLVLTSDSSETWGLVVNEAMACGVPAIVSNAVGCAPDLILDRQTGFTFDCGDIDLLTQQILQCVDLKENGHDWTRCLKDKINRHSIACGVEGTVAAVEKVSGARGDTTSRLRKAFEQRCLTKQPDLGGVRVLVLFGAIPLHGQERGNIEVFRTLQPLGLEPRFITRRPWGKLHIEPELARAGFSYIDAPFGPLMGRNLFGPDIFIVLAGILRTSWIAWRQIIRWKPTHIFTTHWLYLLYCAPAIFFSRLPLIYRLGDAPSNSTVLHRLLWKQIVRRCSVIVCISEFVCRQLTRGGKTWNKTAVIYNYPPKRSGSKTMTACWSRPSGAIVIAFVGQISEGKGIELLIAAVRQLLTEGLNVVLWIAGDYAWRNPLARRLMDEVSTDKLEQRIQFLGYIENVPELLSAADIHAFPSICREGLGNVVLEAKAAGIPTVAFPNGGIPELIRNGEDGLLCEESTMASLVAGLRTYVVDEVGRKRAGMAAKRSLQSRFGHERFRAQWATVFSDVSGVTH